MVRIIDGDTFEILAAGNEQKTIRLDSVDCPDRRQPFFNRAKQKLSGLIFGKNVTVYQTGTHFERKLAFVGNVNQRMVADGFAWNATRYSKSDILAGLEVKAREARFRLVGG